MNWRTIAEKLCSGLEPRRAAEMRGHLADTRAAGARVGLPDVASILLLVVRNGFSRNLEAFFAGLPVLVLYFWVFGMIYEHFLPWSRIDEVPSASPAVVRLHQAVDSLWPLVLLLGFLSGWRFAARVRDHAFGLAGAYVGGLAGLAALSFRLAARNPWFERSLKKSEVNIVTTQSLVLLVTFLALPLAFIAADIIKRPSGQVSDPSFLTILVFLLLAVLGSWLAWFGSPSLLLLLAFGVTLWFVVAVIRSRKQRRQPAIEDG